MTRAIRSLAILALVAAALIASAGQRGATSGWEGRGGWVRDNEEPAKRKGGVT